jgi:hypothetical protein
MVLMIQEHPLDSLTSIVSYGNQLIAWKDSRCLDLNYVCILIEKCYLEFMETKS